MKQEEKMLWSTSKKGRERHGIHKAYRAPAKISYILIKNKITYENSSQEFPNESKPLLHFIASSLASLLTFALWLLDQNIILSKTTVSMYINFLTFFLTFVQNCVLLCWFSSTKCLLSKNRQTWQKCRITKPLP